jgi:hypothetical protein
VDGSGGTRHCHHRDWRGKLFERQMIDWSEVLVILAHQSRR